MQFFLATLDIAKTAIEDQILIVVKKGLDLLELSNDDAVCGPDVD